MLHNRDKGLAMSCDAILSEMQEITRRAAEPWTPGDSVKAAIDRAARRLDMPFRRARTFWYGTPSAAVRAAEADRLRAIDQALLVRRRENLERELAEIKVRLEARERSGNGGVAKTTAESYGTDNDPPLAAHR